MDKLFSAINQKKQSLQDLKGNHKRWIHRAEEFEKQKVDAKRSIEQRSEAKRKCLDERLKKLETFYDLSSQKHSECDEDSERVKGIPTYELIRRLRKLRQPAILFGETHEERCERLYQNEIEVENVESTQNIYVDTIMGRHNDITSKYITKRGGKTDDFFEDYKHLPKESKHYRIFNWVVEMLKIWENEITSSRDELIKKGDTLEAKRKEAMLVQTKRDIKPLLKLLKSQKLEADTLDKLFRIVECCEKGEYKDAHDAYMLLAIGNAAWPMGVTMVGIHERAGRSKIFTSEVAHILNDETTRKYIQMFKRLISFSQSKCATDPSKQVQISTIHI